MVRKTASFETEQSEWIETVAQRRGVSEAWVLRRLVDEARGAAADFLLFDGHQDDASVEGDLDRLDELEEDYLESISKVHSRLSDLEQRVVVLEDLDDADTGAGDRADHADPPTPEAGDRRDDVQDDVDESGAEVLEGALEGWSPGQGGRDSRERWEAGLAALEWLRDDVQEASRSDFTEALYPDLRVDEDQGQDSWWRRLVKPALDEAIDAGLVEYRHGRHVYRYIGEE